MGPRAKLSRQNEWAIDTTTPAGRLLFHMLAAIAEFERDLIRNRVLAGLRRARPEVQHLGRPRKHEVDVTRAQTLLGLGGQARRLPRSVLPGLCRLRFGSQRRYVR